MKFDQDLCLNLFELWFEQSSTLGSVVLLAMFGLKGRLAKGGSPNLQNQQNN